jgi:Cdc6-like AAA superfamily ATPase
MSNLKTELTPSQTAEILRYIIPQNITLAKEGKLPVALCIEGNAGIAKTSVVKQVASEFNYDVIRINAAETELGD